MADTNISEEHHHAFEALTSGSYENLALFSCFRLTTYLHRPSSPSSRPAPMAKTNT